MYLSNVSNNEAAYQGALAVLQHACSMCYPRVCVCGDSKLVVNQLTGVWRCNAASLSPYYERGLAFVRRLNELCDAGGFSMSHIYREYNADADSHANVAIYRYDGSAVVVVNDAWYDVRNTRILYLTSSVLRLII